MRTSFNSLICFGFCPRCCDTNDGELCSGPQLDTGAPSWFRSGRSDVTTHSASLSTALLLGGGEELSAAAELRRFQPLLYGAVDRPSAESEEHRHRSRRPGGLPLPATVNSVERDPRPPVVERTGCGFRGRFVLQAAPPLLLFFQVESVKTAEVSSTSPSRLNYPAPHRAPVPQIGHVRPGKQPEPLRERPLFRVEAVFVVLVAMFPPPLLAAVLAG